jgi:hypothetical protein
MTKELDFHLDDFAPADADSEYAEKRFWAGDLTVLAQHHTTPNGSHSFVVAHDGSVTWGVPGEPQIAAIRVARDLRQNTFNFERTYHSTVSLAQNWLIERGCTPEEIAQVGDDFMKPADDLTAQVEQQLRMSGGRYEVLDSYTSDYDPCETWTLTRDSNAAREPVRLFLEEGDYETHTYTMREGAFPDEASARQWLDDRDDLLPLPPDYRGEVVALRTRAALSRSAGVPAVPKASPSAPQVGTASTAPRPTPGRSM